MQQPRPNLLVIGAMKASTTLLYDMLGRHPDVWFSEEKEPHYFTDNNFASAATWQAYLRLFRNCPNGKQIIGEASTGYTKMPHVGPTPQRIRMRLGQPKMIYILRDPVSRTVSNYRHSYARGFYQKGFTLGQAIQQDRIIVDASRYHKQLNEYEREFGRGSVLVIIAEELHKNPAHVMAQVEEYLEITPMDIWDAPLERANSIAKVQASAGWRKVTSRIPLLGRLGKQMPPWIKNLARKMVPTHEAPEVTTAQENQIFELIAEDLGRLYQRLGSQIACWPSVQRLAIPEPKIPTEPAPALMETAA